VTPELPVESSVESAVEILDALPVDSSNEIEPAVARTPRRRPISRILHDVALLLGVAATIGLALLVAIVHLHFMRVISPSMEPTIAVGNVVVLKPVPAVSLVEGQVVVLPIPDEGGVLYSHRLTSVREVDGKILVTTKGDANAAPDPWELRIESTSVPLVVAQIPVPSVFLRVGGSTMTQFLAAVLLALIAAPVMMGIIRRTRVGSRLRALPLRPSARRHR
jgi:signal peptidase I